MQADQLFFQQRQGFRHADQHAIERPGRELAGRYEGHGIKGLAVAHQVFLQALSGEERVTAGGHLHLALKAGCQGAEAVIEHQHAGGGSGLLRGEVAEQVFVGGIEGLQRIIVLLWLTNQVELGERAVKQGHGGARLWVIDGPSE